MDINVTARKTQEGNNIQECNISISITGLFSSDTVVSSDKDNTSSAKKEHFNSSQCGYTIGGNTEDAGLGIGYDTDLDTNAPSWGMDGDYEGSVDWSGSNRCKDCNGCTANKFTSDTYDGVSDTDDTADDWHSIINSDTISNDTFSGGCQDFSGSDDGCIHDITETDDIRGYNDTGGTALRVTTETSDSTYGLADIAVPDGTLSNHRHHNRANDLADECEYVNTDTDTCDVSAVLNDLDDLDIPDEVSNIETIDTLGGTLGDYTSSINGAPDEYTDDTTEDEQWYYKVDEETDIEQEDYDWDEETDIEIEQEDYKLVDDSVGTIGWLGVVEGDNSDTDDRFDAIL